MSDINELIHAIGLAEKLASGVAREAKRFPTEDVTKIREMLASARIRADEVAISADLICEADEAEERLKRAVDGIAASEREDRPAAVPFIVSDEIGSTDWQDAQRSGSKVGLVRLRQEASLNPGLDLLCAREALKIAEHRRDVEILDRREAVARAEEAFVKYGNDLREALPPVDEQEDDRPLTDDEKARIAERAEYFIRRRDVRMRHRLVHLDHTTFEISSIHGNLRVRFETDADHGRVRHVEVTDYHPSMADDLAALHALPIPASSMDPAIDPYCDLLDRIRHGFKILTRVVAREAISAGEITSDRDAILARLERVRRAA